MTPYPEDIVAPGFGKRIKLLREIRGLSQRDLAQVLDCDRSTISYWENGHHREGHAILRAVEWILEDYPVSESEWQQRALRAERALAGIHLVLRNYRQENEGRMNQKLPYRNNVAR